MPFCEECSKREAEYRVYFYSAQYHGLYLLCAQCLSITRLRASGEKSISLGVVPLDGD